MELVLGMPCYRLLEKLEAEYDSYKDELADKLKQLAQCDFSGESDADGLYSRRGRI